MKQSTLRRSARHRSIEERLLANEWHEHVALSGPCVLCGGPPGRWGHHLVPKGWLRRWGLQRAIWGRENVYNGAPICDDCHEQVTTHARRITRKDLGKRWDGALAWARSWDVCFPGEPVSSRLEREVPE